MNSVAKIKDFIIERDFESYASPVTAALKKIGYDRIKAASKEKFDNITGSLKTSCDPNSRLTLEDAIAVKQCILEICNSFTKDEVESYVKVIGVSIL